MPNQPMPMPTPDAGAAPDASQGGAGGGIADATAGGNVPVRDLLANIHTGFLQLADVMNASQAITPDDKSRLAGIIKEYESFVSENLSGAPGESAGAAEGKGPETGMVTPEAGGANVRSAL